MSAIEDSVRAAAQRIGFARCGFARIEPRAHAGFVERWLAAGNAADMAYIARGLAKRLDPRLILRDARSIITVGYRYLPPPLPPIDWQGQLRGRVAAYAFGTDYHVIVKAKLQELAGMITALRPDATALAYVDTGAILEREWAAAGGVGWFGKNTNILHTEDGSYFFLGELLTSLELAPDAPVADHCGTCTRCIELCPTQALSADYTLDARRCISYWTIEHRGAIPIAMRPQLGNWIFGCDVCQEVCPWNEKLVRRQGMHDVESLTPYLPDLLQLSDEQFTVRFRGSALQRTKREGLLRNVAVALGNTGNPDAVTPLAVALRTEPSALVRAHIAWALGALECVSARAALQAARSAEVDSTVQSAIETALHNGG